MEDLIKALQIFLKYGNPQWPTNCSHDLMAIMEIDPKDVSKEDTEELERLGFIVMEDEYFGSFRFGSA
ncbi:MAG: hypothetical protein OQK75_11865 [Gammaproteobacteria bacterium]|nr:hypothetical protein [Gammaproteobacteria bacterium]